MPSVEGCPEFAELRGVNELSWFWRDMGNETRGLHVRYFDGEGVQSQLILGHVGGTGRHVPFITEFTKLQDLMIDVAQMKGLLNPRFRWI